MALAEPKIRGQLAADQERYATEAELTVIACCLSLCSPPTSGWVINSLSLSGTDACVKVAYISAASGAPQRSWAGRDGTECFLQERLFPWPQIGDVWLNGP